MRVPIELCEAVIEHCQDDKFLLSSCSLVCKAWVPKSRRLLFSRRCVCLWNSNAEAFCGLSRTLTFYVASIELHAYIFTLTRPNGGHQNADALIRVSKAIIKDCTNLRFLNLLSAETVFPLFAQSSITSTLTTLHLYGDLKGRVKNLSVQAGNILDFIGHFTVLKELSMCYEIQRYIRNAVEPTDGPGSKKATLRFLHTLDLNLPWSIFMLWFLIPGVLRFPSVEKLQIDSECSTGDRTIPLNLQAYLELFSSLKDLTILLHNWNDMPVLNLSRFEALRSIMFKIRYVPWQKISQYHLQRLLDIVESTREEKGEGEPEPLKVVVTVPSNTADVPEIEGITWILQFGAI